MQSVNKSSREGLFSDLSKDQFFKKEKVAGRFNKEKNLLIKPQLSKTNSVAGGLENRRGSNRSESEYSLSQS